MNGAGYEIGDIVKLAGSSTKMCIHDIDREADEAAIEGEIVCRWFNDAGDLMEARFKSAELIYAGPMK